MVKVGELRKQIAQNADRTKNKMTLEKLTAISDMFRKASDDNDFRLLTEEEMWKVSVIFTVLRIQNPKYLRNLKAIAKNFEK